MTFGVSNKNKRILDTLAREQKGPFSIEEASKMLSLPKKEVRILLAYLSRKGWLSRIRSGLYIFVPLGSISPREYREHPWMVANHLFAPCYIGGWSAAEHWEFTDQIFNTVVVITLRKFRHTNINIQGTDYIVKKVSKELFGKTKAVWLGNVKVSVSDPVQTIVDMLNDPCIGGGIRNIMDIICEYFNSSHRNDKELIKYIEKKENKTIYKRLGFLIETAEIDADNLKDVCKKNKSTGYSLLDPGVRASGPYNRKWGLRINVEVNK